MATKNAGKWSRENLPSGWKVLNDAVLDAALNSANTAYATEPDEAKALEAGIAAANGAAVQHGVSVYNK